VLVEGEPGIGKTRLLEWLRDEIGEDATWVEGHCASYGGQPLCHAPAEALRGWVGVEDVVRRGATLERLGLEPDALPYLASLISVDDGEESLPAQFDAGLGGAYEAWLRGLAREQPVVLAMHDLHWADHCTLALVERLVKLIDDLPLLIAATSRPARDGSDRRFLAHARLEHRERVVELRLGALGDSEAGELLSQLAPGELAPEASSELIAVAEGNPLYLEQLLRSLLESGGLEARRTWALTSGPTAQLPIGLESLLVARIAALPRDARAVAQAAAVLGRTFAPTFLGFVSGVDDVEQNLTRLLRANIIRERRAIPNREYAFTHGLLQQAALSTLTRARRRELYRLVAAAHEREFSGSLDDHLELLAFYHARGGEFQRALEYLEQAANRATSLGARTQAADLWTRAAGLAMKVEDPAARARIEQRLVELSV
jgi:predicted ATPase